MREALVTPEEKFAFSSGQLLAVTAGETLKKWVFWQSKKLWEFELIPHANEALEGIVFFLPPGGSLQVCALYARESLTRVLRVGMEGSFKVGERYDSLAREQLEQILNSSDNKIGAPFITES